MTDQVEDSLWVVLVFSPLSREEQTLPSLCGVRSIGVGDILGLLVANVCTEVLVLQRRVTEPEVFLGEDKAPE